MLGHLCRHPWQQPIQQVGAKMSYKHKGVLLFYCYVQRGDLSVQLCGQVHRHNTLHHQQVCCTTEIYCAVFTEEFAASFNLSFNNTGFHSWHRRWADEKTYSQFLVMNLYLARFPELHRFSQHALVSNSLAK